MKRCRSLFSPAVGSKSRTSKYPVDDYRSYDVVVEPFAHAGPIVIERLLNFGTPIGCKSAIVSDADLSVYAIWKVWITPELQDKCSEIINTYKVRLSAVKTTKEDMKSSEAYVIYQELKNKFNSLINNQSSDYAAIAAISLILRKLVFGGVIRCSSKGLNVTLSWDKLKSFSRWNHQWYELDPMCHIELAKDWQGSLINLEQSSFKKFLVLIDPPYWLPYEPGTKRRGTGSMTPAYAVHNPWDEDTFQMAVGSVEKCLQLMNQSGDSRIVHTNYWSKPMQLAMKELSRKYGINVNTTLLGTLTGMNHARINKTNRIECAWEFGGRRMFYPEGFVPVEQKTLSTVL